MLLWNMSLTSRCIYSLRVCKNQELVQSWVQAVFLAPVAIRSRSAVAPVPPVPCPLLHFSLCKHCYQCWWAHAPPPYFALIKSPFFTNRRTFIFPASFFKYQIMTFQILSKQKVQFFIGTATALMYETEMPNGSFLMIFEEAPCIFKTCQNYLFWHFTRALVYVSSYSAMFHHPGCRSLL